LIGASFVVGSSHSTAEILMQLLARRELTHEQVRFIFSEMVAGRCNDAVTAGLLIALQMKGETPREVAAATQVMREQMTRWDPGVPNVLDTCGTGGDGSGTFNISTATALVASGAGARVVKHGNRSVSSKSGSADVLTRLRVKIDGDVEFAQMCLREANFAFCFAPQFHPALKLVANARRALGVPTIFNCLGPLANPAGAARQLLGVGRMELLDLLANTLAELDTQHAYVLCSEDGLDEISLSAPTHVREVRGGQVFAHVWNPRDFGLESCALGELSASDADASAAIIMEVLERRGGAAECIVLANTSAALVAAGEARSLLEGVERARESIRSGAAMRVLIKLQQLSI
jgi:anthranilate phosphoribosyltransferase